LFFGLLNEDADYNMQLLLGGFFCHSGVKDWRGMISLGLELWKGVLPGCQPAVSITW
jgi:hypothetical protein